MRTAAAALVLAACAHAPSAVPPAVPLATRPATAPPTGPVVAAMRSDVKRLSHDVIEAFDRGDVAAVEPRLAPGFVHVEGGSPRDLDHDLAKLRARKPSDPHISRRTWSNEHVFVTRREAVFIGDALEQSTGRNGGYSYDGRYTLAWHFDDGAWQLALYTWNAKSATSDSDFFNSVYKGGTGFTKEPNQLLVTTLASVKPGRALDIMMGQGRNALYLAEHGWKVTGVDFAHEGILEARAAASAKGVPLETIEADVDTFDFGTAKYDLVAMIYAGADPRHVAKAQAAVKPGGMFVLEYFGASEQGMDGPAPGALAKEFAGWDILRDTVTEGVPDWAMNHAVIQRFVARKPRAPSP